MKTASPQQPDTKALRQRAESLFVERSYAACLEDWKALSEHAPSDPDTHYKYAICLRYNDRLHEALQAVAEALELRPDSLIFLLMGQIYREMKLMGRAEDALKQAIHLDDKNHEAWAELAIVYCLCEQNERALLLIQKAMEIKRDGLDDYKHMLGSIFLTYRPSVFNQAFKDIITDCLQTPHMIYENFSNAWLGLLLIDPAIVPDLNALYRLPPASFSSALQKKKDAALFSDPFFIYGIKKMRIKNKDLESFAQKLRSYFLFEIVAGRFVPAHRELLFALSHQCFFNEYVFSFSDEEVEALNALKQQICSVSPANTELFPEKIAVLGCYKALWQSSVPPEIFDVCAADFAPDTALQDLLKVQYREPREEQSIKQEIVSKGTISDDVSQKVREQYEENPYPRWVDYARDNKDRTVGFTRPQLSTDSSIQTMLIAGCGTGQQIAINRIHHPDAHIVAVDISKTSLAYAIRKCSEFGFNNIDFFHADILELGDLEQRFDIIACTGVLHHMNDPFAGWKVLEGLLKAGGRMNIALYSEKARQAVVNTRSFIKEHGYEATAEGIRACREHIRGLPADNPVFRIVESGDFYTLSACRDLVFHVQEHRYTLSMINETLDRLGLEFDFMKPPSARMYNLYVQMFPDDPRCRSLENLHVFEEKYPASFSSMYQFWVRKPA
jgi:SAM-dependent methyltransferase/tetratricopeptide (TPR) repeat protein